MWQRSVIFWTRQVFSEKACHWRRDRRKKRMPGCLNNHSRVGRMVVRKSPCMKQDLLRRTTVSDYIGAIDQGTTSTRFIVFDRAGRVKAVAQKEHEQIYPKPGWVEHKPDEIWQHTREVIAEAMAQGGLRSRDLAAIGITNQRETTVVWNRKTGKPVANALVWQDTRVADAVSELVKSGGQDLFRGKTGLPLTTYFSGLKIRWILEHVKGARDLAEKGEAIFGNIDTFLVWNLTGGSNGGVHITDVTNASRTQLMDLETLSWDKEILKTFEIPENMLPQIRSSSETYGKANEPAI